MKLYEYIDRDAGGRLQTVEIATSRLKMSVQTSVYAFLAFFMVSAVNGLPFALLAGIMALFSLNRTVFVRKLIISEQGVLIAGMFRKRAVPWTSIEELKLITLPARDQFPIVQFLWCFCTKDVPLRERLLSIGGGWKVSPQALFSYLTWYQAKVRWPDTGTDIQDEVLRMELMGEAGMKRAFMIIAGLVGGSGLLAYVLVLLLRSLRDH